MLRFLTSGESHGQALLAVLEGIPSGLALDFGKLNAEMRRRQQGYGRGSRQKIECDEVEILGGVRHGITSGAPIGLLVRNRDWQNWQHVMSVAPVDAADDGVRAQVEKKAIHKFRPGHADLAGTLKFRQADIRDVLERASARETAARVAVGAICLQLLESLDVKVAAHVVRIGPVAAGESVADLRLEELAARLEQSELFCADRAADERMKDCIKEAWQDGDSLGGVVEILADGLPVGLGSYTQWDLRLDGQLAMALMSVQAVKAVEAGDGVDCARLKGSQVHDPLYPALTDGPAAGLPFVRRTNRAGGLEGGMTNGERLVLRAYMKPIPTIRKGLPSVSFPEFSAAEAHYERSDVSAVAACSVVCRSMVAFVLARAIIDKFGGDALADLKASLAHYRSYLIGLGSESGSIGAARRVSAEAVEAEAEAE